MPSILIVGAGAVGALFGSALARQGAQVSVVCRSDFAVVQKGGYDIRSPILGDHAFRPHRVYREVADCKEPPDFLILTVKVVPGVDRVALIRPAIGPRTVIVLIENGIDIEAEIAAAFPNNELLSTLALVAVFRTGSAESQAANILHQSNGELIMGRYPSGKTPAAEQLAALFEASRIPCQLTEAVVTARWQKAVWNATFNSISIMGATLDTATMLKTAESTALVRRTMEEVCAVAAACGHPQHPKLIERMIEGTRAMPAYRTSMALDHVNGRPMEIEAILGNVVRAGRKAGVGIPTLETLYALAKMVEGKALER